MQAGALVLICMRPLNVPVFAARTTLAVPVLLRPRWSGRGRLAWETLERVREGKLDERRQCCGINGC